MAYTGFGTMCGFRHRQQARKVSLVDGGGCGQYMPLAHVFSRAVACPLVPLTVPKLLSDRPGKRCRPCRGCWEDELEARSGFMLPPPRRGGRSLDSRNKRE